MFRKLRKAATTVVAVAATSIALAAPAAAASIGDYLAQEHISQTEVFAHTVGAPDVTFTVPDDWSVDYSTTYYAKARPVGAPNGVTSATLEVFRLDGTVDAATLLAVAKREAHEDPHFTIAGEATGTVGGYATYTVDGPVRGVSHQNFHATKQTVFVCHDGARYMVRLDATTFESDWPAVEGVISTMHRTLSIRP